MQKTQINFSHVLKHMKNLKDDFEEIVEELELLSNPKIRKQIEASLEAEKEGKTIKYSLAGIKKEMDL